MYFGRCGLSRWVVPIDDENTRVIAWRHFREGEDPQGDQCDEVGFGKTDFYGQGPDRSYEQMQADPGIMMHGFTRPQKHSCAKICVSPIAALPR